MASDKAGRLAGQELRTVVQGQDAEAVKMRQPALDQIDRGIAT